VGFEPISIGTATSEYFLLQPCGHRATFKFRLIIVIHVKAHLHSLLYFARFDLLNCVLFFLYVYNQRTNENLSYRLWLNSLFRASELGTMRFFNIFLQPDFIWKLSSYCREVQLISQKMQNYVKQVREEVSIKCHSIRKLSDS
jgi:hypothetical protein